MDDPLDFVDFADVLQHGDPSNWTFRGAKPGSGVTAHSPSAPPGTVKVYDLYDDELAMKSSCITFGIQTAPSAT